MTQIFILKRQFEKTPINGALALAQNRASADPTAQEGSSCTPHIGFQGASLASTSAHRDNLLSTGFRTLGKQSENFNHIVGDVCGVHHFSPWHSTANANLTLCKAARGSEIWKSARIQSRALTRYNGLNACVPSKFLCSAPDPQCDGLGGGASWQWLGREGRSLVKEKVNQGAPWPLCTMWGCKGTSSLQSRGEHTRHQTAGTLILDFPASRTVIYQCVLFQPPSLRYSFTAGWTKTLGKTLV